MMKQHAQSGRPGSASPRGRGNARRRPAVITALAPVLAIGLLMIGAGPAEESGSDVDATRAALEKWVETRRIISREKRDWAMGREMLTARIDLVQRRIETLRTKIDDAGDSIAEADRKRMELIDENEKLKEASSILNEQLVALEERTRALLKGLPGPIRERVKPLSQRVPDDPEDTRLSLAERFQNVIGILNEVTKFNREITVRSEVRTLPDGSSAEVTAMYVGIGQAYYANASGDIAGVGTASPEGWTWTPANEAAPQIMEAIAILENEKVADFVQLPVTIK